ncbi:efflux RND transporter periplasmic adaptor subunit [Enterococcus wangshanyuanii]|uniref:RND transporter n=1 Tax=Enterococcus wangshanyuanii TaxID=2005703 RepID=A0ABQ1NPJ3_9ENTE|nr:efflux RND transporter periplasmic adaptor subunit [Enterococcus wangshanyuanii]GGC82015.1 RND transporter [Enterococcus wangshanyuanii]
MIKNKKVKWVIGGVILSLGIGGYFFLSSSNKASEPSYSAFKLEPLDPLVLKGEINATQSEDIFYDQALGTIASIPVKNEQEVKAGEVVLNYQNSDAQTRADQQQRTVNKSSLTAQQAAQNLSNAQTKYNEVQAALNQSKAEVDRETDPEIKETLKSKVEQQQTELTAANSEVIQAQQALELANTDVNDEAAALETEQGKIVTTVQATQDGIAIVNEAGKKSLDIPLVRVLSKSKQIKGTVTEYDLSKLKTGQEVSVTSIGSNQEVSGKVGTINQLPKTSAGGESEIPTYEFTVEGDFPWPYGSSAQVSLQQPQLILPQSAIVTEGKQTFVYIYKNGRAKKTEVKLSDSNNAKVVESGVSKGMTIIDNPDESLKNDAEVQVVEND